MAFPFEQNSSFSTQVPTLQIYLDSTSLGEFKICPRRYYYNIMMGYQPSTENIHLTFGLRIHEAVENYWKLRLIQHLDHEEALLKIIHQALIATWDKSLSRPWQSDHRNKNRFTLIRTIVWYLDRYRDDPIEVLIIDGKPAVELPFEFDSGCTSRLTKEHFILCGRIDRLGQLNGFNYVTDIKTTQHTLSDSWLEGFTPDNQFTLYCIASKVVFKTETAGLIVDGCQINIHSTAFQRYLVDRTPFQVEEWKEDLRYHLNNLDACSALGKWPQNDKACNLFGGCPYRPVCSQRSSQARDEVLAKDYKRRTWDPLARRQDY